MASYVCYMAMDGPTPIYVGRTIDFEARQHQHRMTSEWFDEDLEWVTEECPNKIAAQKREAALIRQLRPCYNTIVPRLDPENAQPWQDEMTTAERKKLDRLHAKREAAADEWRDYRLKVKSACEWRSKKRKARKDRTND